MNRFLAALSLALVAYGTRAADVSFQTIAKVRHVSGDLTYPESALQCETARGWMFGGAVRGHRGGVRLVDAPGRAGRALELWMDLNKESQTAPAWVFWQCQLHPRLSILGVTSIEVDVMPLDPIDFRITARFGSGDGLGIVPATWSPLGTLEPGRWHTVTIPVHKVRPNIDTLRFDTKVAQPGVPHRQPVRFLVDKFRFLPAHPEPLAEYVCQTLSSQPPVLASALTFSSRQAIASRDELALSVETAVGEPLEGTVVVTVTRPGQKPHEWRHQTTFGAPESGVAISIKGLAEDLGSGDASLAVALVDANGRELATSTGVPLRIYDIADMTTKRNALVRRMDVLEGKRRGLVAAGTTANLPGVSLATAEMFVRDGGFIDDDFQRQREYAHAYDGLEQGTALLDQAETELAQLAAGELREPAVPSHDPSRPVSMADGRILQDGRPFLFVGGIGWAERPLPLASRITERLGFNAASVQTVLKAYFEDTEKSRERRLQALLYLDETERAGLAANLLLAGHYAPQPLPGRYNGAKDSATGSSMLPWNILHPATLRFYLDWYDQVLPLVAGKPHVINVETANEPSHSVRSGATNYETGFRQWLRRRYANIDALNRAWDTKYASFDALELPDLLAAMEAKESKGMAYDWHQYRTEVETAFFGALKDRIHGQLPDLGVTIKIMGHKERFGYALLNEQTVQARAETAIGTDGRGPMWLDYLKSMKPDQPVINAEWHVLGGDTVLRNPPEVRQRMFEGMAHGIAFGTIWKWRRSDWRTLSNGAEQCMTRLPVTLDAIGRTAWWLRSVAGPVSAFANLDGGRARVLYDLDSQLHQGMEYMDDLEDVYWQLSRNTSGVRFLVAGLMNPGDFAGVELVAAGKADALTSGQVSLLADWVGKGGVLWLTAPGLAHDPYGHAYADGLLDPVFVEAVAQSGDRRVGGGRVVVSPTVPDLAPFLRGPWPTDADGAAVGGVEVRLAPVSGDGIWLYLNNRDPEPKEFALTNWPTETTDRQLRSAWDRRLVDLAGRIKLGPHEVVIGRLGHYPTRGGR